jgi:uncharacterized peroxidase-related enzyme
MTNIAMKSQKSASWVGGENDEQMSDEMRALVEAFGGDNWIRALTVAPKSAKRFTDFIASFFAENGTDLSLRERELVAVAVSKENGCGYCTGHHTHNLGEIIENQAQAYRFALDPSFGDLSERETAMVNLARKVTRAPGEISEDDIQRMRHADIPDQQIVEVLETTGYFNFANRMFMALGCNLDDRISN